MYRGPIQLEHDAIQRTDSTWRHDACTKDQSYVDTMYVQRTNPIGHDARTEDQFYGMLHVATCSYVYVHVKTLCHYEPFICLENQFYGETMHVQWANPMGHCM